MAKMRKRPVAEMPATDFGTYREFKCLYYPSVSGQQQQNIEKWVRLLSENQLKIVYNFKSDWDELDNRVWDGWSVAHELAREDVLTEWFISHPDKKEEFLSILSMRDSNGDTVAFILLDNDSLPEELLTEEILMLHDAYHWTIAHELAKKGTLPPRFQIPEILSLYNINGDTVAYVYANRILENERWDLLTPEIIATKGQTCPSIFLFMENRLLEQTPEKRMDSISRMTTNTKQYMLSRVFPMDRESTLFKALRKNLNMETTKEVFTESCFEGSSVQEENTDNFPGDLYLAETPHSR